MDNGSLPGNAELQLGSGCNITQRAELGLGVPGWHSRGYLPHFDKHNTVQSVTFRLADSLPQTKLWQLELQLNGLAQNRVDAQRRRRIEAWLDSGMGCCALTHPKLAALLQETLLKWDADRYRLLAWCIMPNHAHVLVETLCPLAKIVQSWKSFTGRWAMRANAELGLGVPGKSLWMRDYWDRFIRDAGHFGDVLSYIESNPVAAKLCEHPGDWLWSSARDRKL